MKRSELIGSAIVLVLLVFVPWLSPLAHVDLSTFSEVLLIAIAAMSVNLLLGYTGLPAFGNAAYFGLGAYGAGLSAQYFHVDFIVAVLIGTVSGFLGAVILGPFLLRRRGIYFGLLSIAFGEIFYFIAYRYTDVTGGEDGMTLTRPVVGIGHIVIKELSFYYIALAVFVIALIVFRAIVRSPFGRTLVAIRQNEVRVRYLGLNSDRFIFVALLISATMAGVSGALFGLKLNIVYPLQLDWHQSGDFVLMMIIGGGGTLWGPLLGSFIYVIGKDIISTMTPLWPIFLGGLFIACVLGFPRGILGTIEATLNRRRAQTVSDDVDV
jgi:branched-chain amino acid transport system permease protein